MLWNLVQTGETAVVDLLLAADLVQFNYFDLLGVVEVGDGRVVKGQMTVFTDA